MDCWSNSKLHQCLSVCELAPVAGHFIPLYWVLLFELTYCYAGSILLLLDAELRLQQPSKTSGFYSTDRAMKLSYSLTHLRSYVDCIASIFIIKCSSFADQETLIWLDNVRFNFNVLVILCLSFLYYIYLYIFIFVVISCRFCRSP